MNTPSPSDWALVRSWFERAQPLDTAAREALLAGAPLSPALLAEVRSLLAHGDPTTAGSESDFLSKPAVAERPLEPGREGQLLGSWRIVARLGTGGMGNVWLAERADGAYAGQAAIKVLKRGMDTATVLERFAQEQQALARMSHPHIAHLLDAGLTDDGLPYFVMERVIGQAIDAACAGLPLTARLGLFLQLADAVAHAHRKLLVHRDLKPSNVLVTAEQQVKLLDFGIAKALDPLDPLDHPLVDPMDQQLDGGGITRAGERPFTPLYASPEQIRGEAVGTATDIYSLGVLLYVMLTGVRPYGRQAMSARDAARSVLQEQPSRPSTLKPEQVADPNWLALRQRLKGDLDNILLKALAKDIDTRYASVDALADDVRAYLGGYPVSAYPAGKAYVLGKFVRRHRWPVSIGVLGLCGLVLGLTLALQQAQQAAQARDEARQQLAGVKEITNELVFRYGDAIQMIPGGAKTQEAMLKQTVAALDVTLAQAPEDVELNALVASVLGRLTQIQGNSAFAGPERAAEARATAARALALADKAWPARRADVRFVTQHLITLLTKANLLRDVSQLSEGLAMLAIADERAALTLGESLTDTDRAGILELRANVLTNLAHFNDHSGRPSLGRPQEALRYYAQAEAAFQDLYGNAALVAAIDAANDPGAPPTAEWANHNLANVQSGRSLVYQHLDDYASMARELQAALLRRQDNIQHNPTSSVWRQSLMFDSNYLALALLRLGQNDAALQASQRSWDLVAQRITEDKGNALWPTTRSNFAAQYARALAANGRHLEALPIFDMALRRAAELGQQADTPQNRQRAAWLQVQKARSLIALRQPGAALALLHPALDAVQPLLGDARIGRDALLTQAEAFGLLGPAGDTDASDRARATFEAAGRLRPLSPEHEIYMLATVK